MKANLMEDANHWAAVTFFFKYTCPQNIVMMQVKWLCQNKDKTFMTASWWPEIFAPYFF